MGDFGLGKIIAGLQRKVKWIVVIGIAVMVRVMFKVVGRVGVGLGGSRN